VDTDFLVAVLRGDKSALPVIEELDRERVRFTTAINAFELYAGAYYTGEKALREAKNLLSKFHILAFDDACAAKAGEIFAALKRKGLSLDVRDVMIAATALAYELTLVTRNVKHFSRIEGLKVKGW
jgi:predicted nucleic acid-binding protein